MIMYKNLSILGQLPMSSRSKSRRPNVLVRHGTQKFHDNKKWQSLIKHSIKLKWAYQTVTSFKWRLISMSLHRENAEMDAQDKQPNAGAPTER